MKSYKRYFAALVIFQMFYQWGVTARYISDNDLWKHVVTIDRIAWQERSEVKKINKQVNDENFVRRIYLDITGKIPTYEEMLGFLNSKSINKREKLIDELLSSNGYVAHYSNFWQDLLRNPTKDPEDIEHKEFTRYIERFLFENKTYDKIVYDLIVSEGTIHENQAIGFYMRDHNTGVMDTLNATVKAFLGTRIGCAQCHNHRFDKWTQKEFYESAAHLWGVDCDKIYGTSTRMVHSLHHEALLKDKRFNYNLSKYQKRLFNPSLALVKYQDQDLKYPNDYAYDNAKPNGIVKERIVFGYGDEDINAEDKRISFAKWLTSKNNPMFSKIMANRLWNRITGVALLNPIDDWKDNIEVSNPDLFKSLGDIFVSVDFDFKAFLTILFNTEAYQYAYEPKNHFEPDDYKVQGAFLKRMSASQINDSLMTLRYGNIDILSKLDPQYFEFEDKLNALVKDYLVEVVAPLNVHTKKYGRQTKEIDSNIIAIMLKYAEKLSELEKYYQIQKDGRLKNRAQSDLKIADARVTNNKMTMQGSMNSGSSMQDNKGKSITRSYYTGSEFMSVFGRNDRTSTATNINFDASVKQILKMINSIEARAACNENSYLMTGLKRYAKFETKINYLYYSIYGRSAKRDEVQIAANYLNKKDSFDRWSKYALALLNSPEFYFIK